jgi:hydrophobe/amphiphile efflux-1 (HAE1) family protein
MNISKIFIRRPIATVLLMAALLASGIVGYRLLPVAALPNVDFPTISVFASLPGASPGVMASSVAQPLERQFASLPGINDVTSTSVLGSTIITLQFDLSRNIDSAAADVQAAINAAGGILPKNLPNPPTYKKVNPADTPVLLLGLTSDAMPLTELDRYADVNLAQRLSMLPNVGQVLIMGQQKFAPTVRAIPGELAYRGLSFSDVAAAITKGTVQQPTGSLQGPQQSYQIGATGQIFSPDELGAVIVAYRNGAPVRISDIGTVVSGVETPFQAGWVNTKRGEIIAIWRQPGANTVQLVDSIKAALPALQNSIPASIHLTVISDRSASIRQSFTDVQLTLLGTIVLVIFVIFIFLRNFWATLIPAIAVPLSLVGAFGVMYLLGYSLDNISLMGLTLAVGLVVDDAIVMLENIYRHLEDGCDRLTAALKGSAEISFTIVSITVSLIAVFIPILFMNGMMGRLFREFGVTVTIAMLLSAVIALTLSPTLAALVLQNPRSLTHGRLYQWSERAFERIEGAYERGLHFTIRHRLVTMLMNVALIAVTGWLIMGIPKGFLPAEDTGQIYAYTKADQDVSFQGMSERQEKVSEVIAADPDVESFGSSVGGNGNSSLNTGSFFIQLKPQRERQATALQIIARLRPKLAEIPGISTYLQVVQSVRVGQLTATQYQYILQDSDEAELNEWAPKLEAMLKALPGLQDIASDQQLSGPQLMVNIDRDLASRLGVTPDVIEQTLYYAFGQPFVTEVYRPENTYHVIVEVPPEHQQDPSALSRIYVNSSSGRLVPLSQFATFVPTVTSLVLKHHGQLPSVTLSFNLRPGTSLGEAVNQISQAETEIGMPSTLLTAFHGTAQQFQASLATEPLLIAAAVFAVYIVLGVLYESFIHPITILLSLPSASVGAVIGLKLFGFDLSMMAIIGLIMLIGIVKKNAIMMVDFAIERQREQHKVPEEAIYEAAVLRFRPIMMTTMAAVLGTMPIAIGFGAGSDLRQPLGVAVVGGLIVSQALTLFTTPITYLYMERLSEWMAGLRRRRLEGTSAAVGPRSMPAISNIANSQSNRPGFEVRLDLRTIK